jgi:hypothetical protein
LLGSTICQALCTMLGSTLISPKYVWVPLGWGSLASSASSRQLHLFFTIIFLFLWSVYLGWLPLVAHWLSAGQPPAAVPPSVITSSAPFMFGLNFTFRVNQGSSLCWKTLLSNILFLYLFL